jgi:MoxR-like ATPase
MGPPDVPRRWQFRQIGTATCLEEHLLYVARPALEAALPQLGRSALFADLLMMRYCAPDPAALEAIVQAPTVAAGDFAKAVRAYAGLVPAEADTAAANWRLQDSVSEADPDSYFFALTSGGSGREKRWKKGGAFYARAGLHNRLYGGVRGALGRCVEAYVDLHDGEDRWRLRFTPNYSHEAFDGLLARRPIAFWPFALWMVRTVGIPEDDSREALAWVRQTVMSQARLDDSHVTDTEANAIAQSAWFYLGPQPNPDDLFSADAPTFETLRDVCAQFDERQDRQDEERGEPPIERGEASLATTLLDAGNGRRLLIGNEIVVAALTHLALGRHLLLVGPPGTGKSTLAANLARAARDELIAGVVPPIAVQFAIASATWTTFDTLGGYLPTRSDELEFRPGIFLRAFDSDAWLIIDELNRADADKAFGPFVNLLGGSEEILELPFEVMAAGETYQVRLLTESDPLGEPTPGDYVVPNGWRMIATMNTYDKNSLFRLSYAFMRRFAFVFIGTLDVDSTLEAATQGVDLDDDDAVRLRSLLQTCAAAGRALGVAIAADVARYVEAARVHGDVEEPFLDAIVAHVLPQLDTLEPDAVGRVLEGLISGGVVAEGARPRVEEVFAQMLDYVR